MSKELYEVAKPLVDYVRKNYNPHTTVIVTPVSAEILEGVEVTQFYEGIPEDREEKI